MDSARTIKALTECGAISAALKAEHYAIEDALQTLDGAVLAGASAETLAKILDIVIDFCAAHFAGEKQEFKQHGYAGAKAHARAHDQLLLKFRTARSMVVRGELAGTLDAADLLNAFHNHVARFDKPAHAFMLEHSIASGQGDTTNHQVELAQLYRSKAAGRK